MVGYKYIYVMKKQTLLVQNNKKNMMKNMNIKNKSLFSTFNKTPPKNVFQRTPPKNYPLMGVTFSAKVHAKIGDRL